MAEQKNKPNDQNVNGFLDKVSDPARRSECYRMVDLMKRVTRSEPRIWGSGVVL